MLDRKTADPSPIRSGLLHGFISFAVFASAGGIIGSFIHVTGDPAEAGPRHVIALFETEGGDLPALRGRLATSASALVVADAGDINGESFDNQEPSLGVPDPGSSGVGTQRSAPAVQPTRPRGIRINGKLVEPGQRYSQLQNPTQPSQAGSSTPAVDAPSQVEAPSASAASQAQKASFARPFENPQGKPIVSLVIGGLGTSYRHAITAIDELPPEVTLSFVPTASPELLKYARRQGHEILLEIPMESLGRGKARPHRDTLLTNVNPDDNILRMNSLLRGKRELYGVISHKGDKFVNGEGMTAPMLAHLQERELAFFQHGTLERTTFGEEAAKLNMDFAAAQENIDTEIRASVIEAQLFKLETQALDEGAAFATGFSYPLTVDLVARWSRRLEGKGILLAPASAIVAEQAKDPSFQTTQLSLPGTPSDATP